MDRAPDPFGAFVALAPPDGGGSGPLAGLRIAVKDNIGVAGLPFTAGLPRFAGRMALRDAPAVARLRAAGAAIAGVTVTDSGGLGVTTPEVLNPYAPEAIVGGSSGGSAAAVAGGLVDAALGTDTGGSVRIPAACCAVLGFKPTHGRVSGAGVWPLARDLEDIGVLAARFPVLEAVAHVLLGSSPATSPRRSIVIGFDWERLASCDAGVAAAFREALRRLEHAGCTLLSVRLPDRDDTSQVHGALALRDAALTYRDAWTEGDSAGLGRTAWRALEAAHDLTEETLGAARAIGRDLAQAWETACSSVDCIASPTLPVPVPLRGTRRVQLAGIEVSMVAALTAETSLANLVGVPALSMPLPHGPASLQLMAAGGRDEALLADAARIHAMLEAS